MNKKFGYKYIRGGKGGNRKKLLKKLSALNGLLLVGQMSLSSLFLIGVPMQPAQAIDQEDANVCAASVDVVMIMDRSGSMGYTSKCVWWQYKCLNSPSCTLNEWVQNTSYNESQIWCTAKTQASPRESAWTGYSPTKIAAAKSAANTFLGNMKVLDQSALVSFATNATLDKQLSSNHAGTQAAVNSLVVTGATNIGGAINEGINELNSVRATSPIKTMILLTDGKANKPNGPGYGEYAADVVYAESRASAAKASGIKIFTIGLGTNGSSGEINEDMLKNIASYPAYYYHAPTSGQLEIIYDEISDAICCGDGVKNGAEQCDGTDGVGINQECSATCTLTDLPYCGDSIKNGSEQCDGTDGVGINQECSANCTLANVPYCGDSIKNGSEQCDGTDGVGVHQSCSGSCILINLPYCGDNIINQSSEVCDGNQPQECTLTNGYKGTQTCAQCVWSECISQENCGDGVKNNGEQCDGTDGVGSNQSCSDTCTLINLPYCGDSIKNGSEQCDGTDGVGVHQSCSGNCTLINLPYCGDGIKNGLEQCDSSDGVDVHHICTGLCTLEYVPYCGDGACNSSSGENCETCSSDCGSCGGGGPVCGNGVVESGEQCDNSVLNGTPGYCNLTCTGQEPGIGVLSGYKYRDSDGLASTSDLTVISGWKIELFNSSSTTVPFASTTTDVSGYYEFNQLLFGSFTLKEESRLNWTPISNSTIDIMLSAATTSSQNNFINYFNEPIMTPRCGDGLLNQTSEQCDDGNTVNGDDCSSTCQTEGSGGPVCGDGSCSGNETCSTCSSDCGSCSSGGGGGGGGGSTMLCILNGTCNTATLFSAVSPIVAGETSQPVLTIIKTVDRLFANPGDQDIKYTIIVKNTGNLTAFNVEVTDELPAGLQRTNDSGVNMSWRIGDLEPNASKEIKYSVNIAKEAKAMVYKNIASAKADNHPSVTASASLEVKAIKVLAATGFDLNELLLILLYMAILIGSAKFVQFKIKPDINS